MAPTPLPDDVDDAELAALLRDDPDRFRSAVDLISSREGLETGEVRFCPDGSRPVFASDAGWVIKLFPPHETEHHRVEREALEFLAGRLPAATPDVLGAGEIGGWPYLAMTRLPGEPLSELRDHLDRREVSTVAAQLGELLAELHEIDTAPLGWDPAAWPRFVAERRASCADEQRELGLDERWAAQIDPFLDRHAPDPGTPVFLHTEVMAQHVFVTSNDDGGARLSGLIDLEPAMLGASGYEFAAVGLFVTEGDPELLRTLLEAYGVERRDLTGELQRELMAWTLLHRYAHLPWFLERMPPASGVTSLEELAAQWFALGTRDAP